MTKYAQSRRLFILKYLINNTYITIANDTYRQCIGIPMGTNAGVNIAEYYLVKYEFNFLIQLKLKKLYEVILEFNKVMRYLDDIAVVDNTWFADLLYKDVKVIIEIEEDNQDTIEVMIEGIYLREALTIQLVTDNNYADFMDATTFLHPTTSKEHPLFKCWILKSYDNLKYKQIKFIKYPSANSLNPISHGLNIVLTQCNRFYKLNTLRQDFVKDVTKCLIELQLKGYDKQSLIRTLKRFIFAPKRTSLYGNNRAIIFSLINTEWNKHIRVLSVG